jgi:hypothetical protein
VDLHALVRGVGLAARTVRLTVRRQRPGPSARARVSAARPIGVDD